MIDSHHMHLQQFRAKRPNLSSFKGFKSNTLTRRKKHVWANLLIKSIWYHNTSGQKSTITTLVSNNRMKCWTWTRSTIAIISPAVHINSLGLYIIIYTNRSNHKQIVRGVRRHPSQINTDHNKHTEEIIRFALRSNSLARIFVLFVHSFVII